MKKVIYSIMAAVAMLLPLGSCSDDEPTVPGGGTVVGAGDDMPEFDIEFDATPLKKAMRLLRILIRKVMTNILRIKRFQIRW